jgi:DHA1 family bicyclomycin/chloramphenicol resistance-like MFS transporter
MDAVRQMFGHTTVRLSILVQSISLGILFTMLTMVQPVYDIVFDRADSFPLWFGGVALVSGSASLLNAVVVVRIGMRRIVTWSLGVQIILSGFMVLLSLGSTGGDVAFYLFVVWQACVFFMAGTTLGNLSAIAMEPMGHIAGMAASVIGAVSTVLAAAIAAPVGLLFDGSMMPLTVSICVMSAIGFVMMLKMGRIEILRGEV